MPTKGYTQALKTLFKIFLHSDWDTWNENFNWLSYSIFIPILIKTACNTYTMRCYYPYYKTGKIEIQIYMYF